MHLLCIDIYKLYLYYTPITFTEFPHLPSSIPMQDLSSLFCSEFVAQVLQRGPIEVLGVFQGDFVWENG